MKWLRRILMFILVVVVALGLYGVYLARRPFPTVQGEVEISSLTAPVEVTRDTDGIPHIYASNMHDLYLAQGYVVAQDRFWQMDFWRHIGSGRLAEMFGEDQVGTDEFLRSLGFTTMAEKELKIMDPGAREILDWYAEGVNAYLSDRAGSAVSLEYAILGLQNSEYEIEPWSPINTMTWAKVMSWDLSANMADELDRAILSVDLPRERVEQLYPPFPDDHPVIVDESGSRLSIDPSPTTAGALSALASAKRGAQSVWDLTGGGFEGIGSNNWVIAGDLTVTGMPLLANDPHLAPQMPSIWYEVGLHCTGPEAECGQDRIGFTFAGAPGIVVGHNENIAWGVTTEAVDTEDIFIEKVNPEDPDQYEYEGEWREFKSRVETIVVAGEEDVRYEVKRSRHGPIISDLYFDDSDLEGSQIDLSQEYAVALAWQSLEPSTLIEAILQLNEAEGYDDFVTAAAQWDIAAQNLVYADIEGNIAYQSTGEVPIRAAGDGRWPVPGWTSQYEWTGLVPFDEMPSLLNPDQGFIVTANQPVTRVGAGPFEGYDWAPGYRAFRINEMIAADDHSVGSVQEMQMDAWDGGAETLAPYLLEAPVASADTGLVDLIEVWAGGRDPYQAAGDSAGAAAYEAVWRHVLSLTFDDDLPEWAAPTGGGRWFQVVGSLLESPDDPFWDDSGTSAVVESRDDILARAVSAAHNELVDLLGDDTDTWEWGRLHIAEFENQTLGQSGIAPIEMIFNRTAPDRVGGGPSLVNATGWDAGVSYLVDWVPSFRMVIDLGDLSSSTGINTTGQSGHVFTDHYQDMIEDWVDGRQRPLRWTREQVEASAESTLTLVPSS